MFQSNNYGTYRNKKTTPKGRFFYNHDGWSGMTQNNIIVKKAIKPTRMIFIRKSGAAQTEMPIKIYMLDRICHFFRRGIDFVFA